MENLKVGDLKDFCKYDTMWCNVKPELHYQTKKVDYEGLIPYLKEITAPIECCTDM